MSALPLCATCESAPASFQYVWGSDKPQVCCAGCLPGLVDGADRYRRSFSAHPLPLIAAAPELLEAVKELRTDDGCWCHPESWGNGHSAQCHAIQEVVAKAEGTPPGRANQSSEPTQPTEAKL